MPCTSTNSSNCKYQQGVAAADVRAATSRPLAVAAEVAANAAAAAKVLLVLQLAAVAVVSKASWRCFSGSRSSSLLVLCPASLKGATSAVVAVVAVWLEQLAVVAAGAGVLHSSGSGYACRSLQLGSLLQLQRMHSRLRRLPGLLLLLHLL
jgi:hypothetical protein